MTLWRLCCKKKADQGFSQIKRAGREVRKPGCVPFPEPQTYRGRHLHHRAPCPAGYARCERDAVKRRALRSLERLGYDVSLQEKCAVAWSRCISLQARSIFRRKHHARMSRSSSWRRRPISFFRLIDIISSYDYNNKKAWIVLCQLTCRFSNTILVAIWPESQFRSQINWQAICITFFRYWRPYPYHPKS